MRKKSGREEPITLLLSGKKNWDSRENQTQKMLDETSYQKDREEETVLSA